MLFFMHLIWEANWKYVLTIPASIMSIFLLLMLFPDVLDRTRTYSEERWLHAAKPKSRGRQLLTTMPRRRVRHLSTPDAQVLGRLFSLQPPPVMNRTLIGSLAFLMMVAGGLFGLLAVTRSKSVPVGSASVREKPKASTGGLASG